MTQGVEHSVTHSKARACCGGGGGVCVRHVRHVVDVELQQTRSLQLLPTMDVSKRGGGHRALVAGCMAQGSRAQQRGLHIHVPRSIRGLKCVAM